MIYPWRALPPWVRGALLGVAVASLLHLVSRGIADVVQTVQVNAALPALAGKVVVIDPGHGGQDPGGIGVRGTREKEVTLAVALQLHDLLLEIGAKPVLTRSTDTDLMHLAKPGPEKRRRRELLARVEFTRQHQADLFISIHANVHGKNTPWQGAQTFWDPRGVQESAALARAIQEELRRHTSTRRVHRPIEQYILQHAPVPAATVEVGFLSNSAEEALLRQPDHQKKLAYAVFAGIARYFASQPGVQVTRKEMPVPVHTSDT